MLKKKKDKDYFLNIESYKDKKISVLKLKKKINKSYFLDNLSIKPDFLA